MNAQYVDRYGGWTLTTDHDSKTGVFKLLARDGINHLDFIFGKQSFVSLSQPSYGTRV